MEDVWEGRFSFFRRSIVIDGVCPVIGAGIVVYQTLIQSGLLPPYIAALGLIGLPGITRIGQIITQLGARG